MPPLEIAQGSALSGQSGVTGGARTGNLIGKEEPSTGRMAQRENAISEDDIGAGKPYEGQMTSADALQAPHLSTASSAPSTVTMKVTSILGLTLALVASPAVAAPAGSSPDPGTVHINNIGYGGSGCPQGSASASISGDQTTMTMIFDKYIASIGPNVDITESRKNCQLNIDVRYPAGFQYSIFTADYRGFADLDAGVTGTQKSTYYFSGQTQQFSTQSTFKGPVNKDYLEQDKADVVTWSPCASEGMVNINSQVRLQSSNPKAKGLLTTDSVDVKFTQILHFQWRKC
ncbi:MAG: hypothetical protein M1839_005682 [Geoglossum umbratile]|nr:MAG: hypothetical protein M1839_005682 [Geoglossum umbratile]